jgi:outer membrane protein
LPRVDLGLQLPDVSFYAIGSTGDPNSPQVQFIQRRKTSMRGKVVLSISIAIMSLPMLAWAQATASQAGAPGTASPVIGPAKVAWLGLEAVIAGCNEGKQLIDQFQKVIAQKNTEMETMSKDLEQLRSQLEIQGSKLTEDARADLEERIASKETDAQRFQEDTQRESERQRTKITNQIGKKMLPVVDKLSKERGLTFVLYINPQIAAWIDPNVDITEDVIKAYDAAYPVAATPAK